MKYPLLFLLAACGPGIETPSLDAAATRNDAPPSPRDAAPDSAATAYRHTIAIDGTNDFVAAETFATTSSPSYRAMISWDDDNVYLGYSGPDLDPTVAAASTKWLFAYIDVDPGTATGATASQTYNTQSATLPAGFGAEYHVRRKSDGTLTSLEAYASGAWSTSMTTPTVAQTAAFVELAIPRAALGAPGKIAVTTWMINEGNLVESTYAGLYAGNFVDGYDANATKAIAIDFTASRAPNDPANAAP